MTHLPVGDSVFRCDLHFVFNFSPSVAFPYSFHVWIQAYNPAFFAAVAHNWARETFYPKMEARRHAICRAILVRDACALQSHPSKFNSAVPNVVREINGCPNWHCEPSDSDDACARGKRLLYPSLLKDSDILRRGKKHSAEGLGCSVCHEHFVIRRCKKWSKCLKKRDKR